MKTLAHQEQDDIRSGVREDLPEEGVFPSCYLKGKAMKIIRTTGQHSRESTSKMLAVGMTSECVRSRKEATTPQTQ